MAWHLIVLFLSVTWKFNNVWVDVVTHCPTALDNASKSVQDQCSLIRRPGDPVLLPIIVQALFSLDVINDTTSLEFLWVIFCMCQYMLRSKRLVDDVNPIRSKDPL